MCGIIGIIDTRNPIGEDRLTRLGRMMAHRGPDSWGVYSGRNVGLGGWRLRIHDLSPKSDQPFFSTCKKYCIVFNGAIYNYRELKEELKREGGSFYTNSDTEVLLEGFILRGPEFVKRLEGMFAYLIYDIANRRLYIFRDHIGIKPLYIYSNDDLLIVASEIKPILSYPGVPKRLNERVIPEFFAFQHLQPPDTFFKDIDVFPPGTWASVSADDPRRRDDVTFWSIRTDMTSFNMPDSLENIFLENLDKCWRTDRVGGIQLSGGVDSSLMTAYSRDILKIGDINTYSVIFDDSVRKFYKPRSEEAFIKDVAKRFFCNARFYLFTAEEIRHALPNAIWHHEAPLYGASTSLYYLLAEKIKNDVTVLLTGEGVDDIFLGYFRDWEFNERPESSFKFFVPMDYIVKLFNLNEENDPLRKKIHYLKSEALAGMTSAQKTSAITITSVLHGLLARYDRMFMAHGIEGRPPFCSRGIIEKRYTLPDSDIYNNGIGKFIIKKMAERYFEPEFVYREKIGFSSPYGDWSSDPAYWGDYWRLLDREFIGSIMDLKALDQFLSMEDGPQKWAGKNLNLLFSVLNFQIWYSLFFDTERKSALIEDYFKLSV